MRTNDMTVPPSRIRKVITIIIVSILCLSSVIALVGCSPSKPKEPTSFQANYDKAKWQESISAIKQNNVKFAENGVSDYTIVYPDELDLPFEELDGKKMEISENARLTLKNAVGFLKDALGKIVGDTFEVSAKSAFLGGNSLEIVINSEDTRLQNDGYGLTIDSGKILIIGANFGGAQNGIYDFLEKYLGCMFVAVDYDYMPSLPTINFDELETFHNPDMLWRMVYANESKKQGENTLGEPQRYSKLKLNGGGMEDWGKWVHTFFTYVPPEEFFETHPEYFGEYNGVRKYEVGPVAGQLCLTNDDVYKIVTDRLFAMMEENPNVRYWDVSQMDTWINKGTGCTCKNCKALDDAEGSPMGSLLTFINRIADECADKFPNNFISTLAYNYSATPPKTLKPKDNVIIKLCFMPGDVTSDLDEPRSKEAKRSKEILEQWSKISKHVLIWDYNVNFHQYLMPYPIYGAMQATNDFYLDNNVYGVFHQMDNDKGGYSAELSSYVFAQIMWDRTLKVEDIVNKYLSVYYGDAAGAMAEYYSSMEENVYKANRALYLYSPVFMNTQDYLSIGNVNKYLKMFDKAEQAAAGDEALIARIKKAKVGVLYVKAQEVSLDKKARLAALEEFKQICDANGIDSLYEGNPKKDNEVQTFYNKQLSVINAIPWIIVAIVVGVLLIIAGIIMLVYVINKKSKKRASRDKNNKNNTNLINI